MQGQVRFHLLLSALIFSLFVTPVAMAEEDAESDSSSQSAKEPTPPANRDSSKPRYNKDKRKYTIEDTSRTDAGIFHVAFAAGGNFWVEPDLLNGAPTGDYIKDFGFQGGAYFDYDYSELPQNIPLALRGMIGYKYVLNSVHVFTFDGMVRHMIQLSEYASFGLGIGVSAAGWYRVASSTPPLAREEFLFLPSFIVGAGFDFNPFMVDFKWLINRFGPDTTITGFELNFGFRL